MRSVRRSGRIDGQSPSTALEEIDMTATYTFDVFPALTASAAPATAVGRLLGQAGPELLDHRLALYDAVVARLKEESEVPLRSHGSVSMNPALMAAGLIDRVQ